MSHTHIHSHAHAHAVEDYSARKHPEFVVLELGDDVGALIVHVDAEMHGVELEISPSGEDEQRSHRQVLERSMGGRPAYTALFDGLTAGSYTLWIDDEARARSVGIVGGAIAELDWRTAR